MANGVTAADRYALDQIRRGLEVVAGTFDNARTPLHDAAADARAGAGQVAGILEDGLCRFEASWGGVLHAVSETCGLLAANTGAFSTTVQNLDVDLSAKVVL